jgi:hypothetical protein
MWPLSDVDPAVGLLRTLTLGIVIAGGIAGALLLAF